MEYSASPILRSLARAASTRGSGASLAAPSAKNQTHAQPQHEATDEHFASLSDEASDGFPVVPRPSALQHVLINAARIRVARWMTDEADKSGEKFIVSRAVRRFPDLFRGKDKANNSKASRIWKDREALLAGQRSSEQRGEPLSITRVTNIGFKRVYSKARPGRGRKRAPWVASLHVDLLAEFDRLRKAGLKFNARLLQILALHLVSVSSRVAYHAQLNDARTGKCISDLITPRWVQSFMNRH